MYYRASDKVSSEGESFPDLVPAGSPATSFPVRENIIIIGEDETEIGWRSDFETLNNWGKFSAGIRITQVDLDYGTVLDGDWIRYVYDDDGFRPDPNQRFITLTPANIDSSLSQKETNYAGYVEQVFETGDFAFFSAIKVSEALATRSFGFPGLVVANRHHRCRGYPRCAWLRSWSFCDASGSRPCRAPC